MNGTNSADTTGEQTHETTEQRFPDDLRDLDYQNVTGADVKPVILGRTTRYRYAHVVFHVGEDEDAAEPMGFELDYEQARGLAEVFQKLADDLEPDEEDEG